MKSGQSILDLLNLLSPVEIKPPLSNPEAQSLYNIWKSGKRDSFGRIMLSSSDDNIRSLKEKDILQISQALNSLAVSITPRGKEIIRQIILYGEKSALDFDQEPMDYNKIYRSSKGIPKLASKIACSLDSSGSWLKRICK